MPKDLESASLRKVSEMNPERKNCIHDFISEADCRSSNRKDADAREEEAS